MRVTTFGMNSQYLLDLNQVMDTYQGLEHELSTGRKLNQPSDDPVAFSADINIQTSLKEIDGWNANAGDALSRMQTADASMDTLQSVLGNIRTEVVQAMNGTNTPSDLQHIQSVVLQQIQNVVQVANTYDGTQYIFAGTSGTQSPLSITIAGGQITGYTWKGTGIITTMIGDNVPLQVNVEGDLVFNQPPPSGGPGLMSTLQAINNDLFNNNVNNLDADLANLDNNLANISALRADLGGRMSRAQAAQSQWASITNTFKQQKSQKEDADMAQLATSLATQQTVYQAALKAGVQMILPTLADVLK